MRKLKLLFAALALFAGGMTASAQDAGTYYIQNVSNGKWLGPGNNWSTQASVLNHADYWKAAKISDGVYTLESVVSNGGTSYYLNGTYCDGSATNFTFAAVAGKENTYTIANGDGGLLTTNGTTVDVSGTDATAEASQWKLWSESDMAAGMTAATVENPFDATYLIKDHDLGRNNRDYSSWSNTGATAPKTSMKSEDGTSVYSVEAYKKTFDVNQTLTGVPNGVYALRVNGFYRQDGSDAIYPYLYANDSKATLPVRTGTENDMQQAAVSFVAGNYLSDAVYVQVTDGTLKVGVKTEGNSCWVIFKNFHLTYYGNVTVAEVLLADYVKAYNEALTEAQAFTESSMFASDWTALQTAITDNAIDFSGSVDQSELETKTANLKAANTAATAAVAKKTVYDSAVALINGGENVDLTSIVVNAGFEDGNLNGWTTVDGGAPTNNNNWSKEGTWYVERWTANGDNQNHLSDGTLTHDALVLPAGLYTITAKAQNQEQKNGVAGTGYFLYANDEKVEITGTNDYSTSVLLASDKSELVIKFALESCTGNWVSCDNVRLTYVGEDFPAYTLVTGKMNADVAAAQTAADEAFQANRTVSNYNALTAAIAAAQASKDAYTAAATAIANAKELQTNHNFATAAAATTFAEAIEALETPYNNNTLTTNDGKAAGTTLGTVVTGWHSAANSAAVAYLNNGFSLNAFDEALYINTWSKEGENDGSNFKVPFYEYFGSNNALAAKTWTATLTGLENGLYSVSAWVRVQTTAADVADATGVTVDVNGGTAIDATAGTQIGQTKFLLEEYTAEGLVKNGILNFNVNVLDGNNISWLSFKNVKYTKVRDLTPEEEFVAATAEDYAALNTAIAAHTLGFEAGEYAPYNNVAGVAAVAAAQAIDQTVENSQEDVQAATAAITGATWTANAAEVNAIFDGSFEYDYSGQSGNVQPIGWYRNKGTYTGDGYNVRYVTVPSGIEGNTSGHGLFGKFTMQYGDEDGYTLPLKAGTYKLTFMYGGYGENGTRELRMTSGENNAVFDVTTITAKNNKANNEASAYSAYSSIVTVPTDGNYVFSFYRQNTTSQNQIAIVDIKLVKATAADLTDQIAAEIDNAKAVTNVNVGENVFQIPTSAWTALQTAITTAEEATPATYEEAQSVLTAIQNAQTTYANAELNAPDAAKRYTVTMHDAGKAWDGNAITFIAGGREGEGNYNVKYEAPANVNLAQALKFTSVEGKSNTFYVSVVNANGTEQYLTSKTLAYGDGAVNDQIRTIDDVTKAVEISVKVANDVEGFKLFNQTGTEIARNSSNPDNGLYPNGNVGSYFTIAETSKPSIAINTTAAGYGTVILPFAQELPTGVKAYSCAEVSGTTLTLVAVDALEANKPYIIEGAWDETVTGDAQGTALTYTDGLLTGVYKTTAAINDTYILQKQDETVGFFKVNTEVATPNVPANRAYLTTPAGARPAAFFFGGEATAINAINALTAGQAEIYDVNGVKQNKLQKGMNIIRTNGKTMKVMVK
jgi:hypothetical protein